MPTGAAFANSWLKLVCQATAIANIADNAASSPLTNLYWSLHTADPAGGTQNTNEISYTTYARVASARTSGGLTVTANVVQPVTDRVFPNPSAGSGTATYAALGTLASGAGVILWSGPITPSITITIGTAPTLTSASTLTISP